MAAFMNLQLPVRSGSVGLLAVVILSLGPRKCGYKRSDRVAIFYGNRVILLTTRCDTFISGLTAAILDFRLPYTADNIFSLVPLS